MLPHSFAPSHRHSVKDATLSTRTNMITLMITYQGPPAQSNPYTSAYAVTSAAAHAAQRHVSCTAHERHLKRGTLGARGNAASACMTLHRARALGDTYSQSCDQLHLQGAVTCKQCTPYTTPSILHAFSPTRHLPAQQLVSSCTATRHSNPTLAMGTPCV